MAKLLENAIDEELKQSTKEFNDKIKSDMHFNLNLSGDLTDFSWLDEIEQACPFIDNVVRHPKLVLVREEITVKTEKSKKVNVSSVKDLARHTNYITKVDAKTQEVQPEKILDIRNEETYNIYENRFLYTLIDQLNRFLFKKEDLLKNYSINNDKLLEYVGTSKTSFSSVRLEVKMTSREVGEDDPNLADDIEKIKQRVARIREYITSWYKSEMMVALEKAHVPQVLPPLKKTNILLKNPNFQVAQKLWSYLNNYGRDEEKNDKKVIDNNGDERLKDFLDDSFLFDYLVLESISKRKRDQKEKLCKASVLLLSRQFGKTLKFLNDNGYDLSADELLSGMVREIKYERGTRLVGADDVKKKFKSVMDEYIERTLENLE